MKEIETISWRELTGNKFVRGVDPAMLTKNGYVKQSVIRRIGEARKDIFNVVYDREYLIGTIGQSICRPMSILGKEKLLKLVSEAWDVCYPYTVEKPLKSPEFANDNYSKV